MLFEFIITSSVLHRGSAECTFWYETQIHSIDEISANISLSYLQNGCFAKISTESRTEV
jgi:hypothetical protein